MDHTFEAFVAGDGARLGRLCHQLTGSHDDALDLAQEVLTRVWQRWPRVVAADHPYAYVRRIAVNTHLNSIRKGRPSPSDEETAAILGCRRATVRSLVARGLETLRSFDLDGSRP